MTLADQLAETSDSNTRNLCKFGGHDFHFNMPILNCRIDASDKFF